MLPPVESTLQAMDAADVDIALLSAWHGPEGSLISNEEVADQIDQARRALSWTGDCRSLPADGRSARDQALGRPQELRWRSGGAVALGSAAERPPLLSGLRRLR